MSKILVNNLSIDIIIQDTGVTVQPNNPYTIPPEDYAKFAASSDVIRSLADDSLVLNNGGDDITNLSDAVDIIKGWPVLDSSFFFDTAHYNGDAFGTIIIPDTTDGIITEVLIDNINEEIDKVLFVSFDEGQQYKRVPAGGVLEATLSGEVNQIYLFAEVEGTLYEALVNRKVV